MSHIEQNPEGQTATERADPGYGVPTDGELNGKAILWSIVGLIVLVAVSMFLMLWMMNSMQAKRAAANPPDSPLAAANERWVPPGPALQEYPPVADIHDLRAHDEEILTTYDWVDEDAGVVRIPVAQALRILEERGLPEPADVETLSDELFGDGEPDAVADEAPEDEAPEDGASEGEDS